MFSKLLLFFVIVLSNSPCNLAQLTCYMCDPCDNPFVPKPSLTAASCAFCSVYNNGSYFARKCSNLCINGFYNGLNTQCCNSNYCNSKNQLTSTSGLYLTISCFTLAIIYSMK